MIGYLKDQKKWVFKTKEKALFSSTQEHVPNEIKDLVYEKKDADKMTSVEKAKLFSKKQRKRHDVRVTQSQYAIRKNAHNVLSLIYDEMDWKTSKKFEKERKERKKLHDMHRKEYILKKQEKALNFKSQKRNQFKRKEYNLNSQHYLTSAVSVHQQKKTLSKLLTLKDRKPVDDMIPELVNIEEDMLQRRNATRMKQFSKRETSLRTKRIQQEVEDEKFHERIKQLKKDYLIKHIKEAKKSGSTNPLMIKYIKPRTPKVDWRANPDTIGSPVRQIGGHHHQPTHHNPMGYKETYQHYLSKSYVEKRAPSKRPVASINSPPSSLMAQHFSNHLPPLHSSDDNDDEDDTTSVSLSTKSNVAFQQAQRAYFLEKHRSKQSTLPPFRAAGPIQHKRSTPPPRRKATYNFRNMEWNPSWELTGTQKPYAIYKLENEFEDKMNPDRRRKLNFWKLHVTDMDLYTDLLYSENTMNTTIQDGFSPSNSKNKPPMNNNNK